MNLFYEEAGAFKVGKVLQEQGASYQVETLHGKRSKVKANHVMVTFNGLDGHDFVQQVEAITAEIDTELLWECAPSEEFVFDEMAELYFGDSPSPVQKAAILTALHASPVYFHRKGKGKYRAAPEDILKAALAGLEKKRQIAEQQDAWATALADGQLPEPFKVQAAQLLAKPDKNTTEYKALMEACGKAGRSPELLLLQAGAFTSVHDLMRARFNAIYFPKGTQTNVPVPEVPSSWGRLPLAPVKAFSIDDSSTTEIDDAFSVQFSDDNTATVGVHIAAPSLLIERDSALDRLARDRMSTVYAPGEKITMLPEELVEMTTLAEGRTVPAASLYVKVDCITGELLGEARSLVEMVPVAANLRHNLLDEWVTRENLEDPLCQELEQVGEFFPALK
ncbi:MAG: ribonuclease catalytic domain-containing protein, partial [Limnobacter sp.]|nr:ribonuclease catalytic domain-containing protein [Limnobacter sp.]